MQANSSLLFHHISQVGKKRKKVEFGFHQDDLSIITNRAIKVKAESQEDLKDGFVYGFQKRRIRAKRWRENNRDYIKQYRKRKHERILELQREWRKRNPDKVKATQYRWREKHREKYRAYQREWARKNSDKKRAREKENRAKRYKVDKEFTERRKQINRETYHRAKQKIIDEIGLDGWKLQQKQLREKRKHDKNSKSS